MKKINLVMGALIATVASANVIAAGNNLSMGTFGLNVSTQAPGAGLGQGNPNFLMTGKYVLQSDMALLMGFGFGSNSATPPAPAASTSSTDISFLIGARKYFSAGDLSPFIGGRFDYISVGGATTVSAVAFAAEAGAEYFLNKHFSLEGSVGAGYTSADLGAAQGKRSFFGTNNYGLSANFYF